MIDLIRRWRQWREIDRGSGGGSRNEIERLLREGAGGAFDDGTGRLRARVMARLRAKRAGSEPSVDAAGSMPAWMRPAGVALALVVLGGSVVLFVTVSRNAGPAGPVPMGESVVAWPPVRVTDPIRLPRLGDSAAMVVQRIESPLMNEMKLLESDVRRAVSYFRGKLPVLGGDEPGSTLEQGTEGRG